MTKQLPLSYRAAAVLLGCSHQTVGNLLRAGTLADLRRETVTALAATYRPRDAHAPGPGRSGGWTGGRVTIELPDGRSVQGWPAATAATGIRKSTLRHRAEWRDGRYVIRERSRP